MLSDRCPVLSVCLSCLSVTLVYCGQTVGRIKMKHGTQVGLVSGHIVLDADPAPPPQKGPIFRPISIVAKWLDHDATWYDVGLGPGHIVLDGDPAHPQKGTTPSNFRPMSIVTKRSPISATAEHLVLKKGWVAITQFILSVR